MEASSIAVVVHNYESTSPNALTLAIGTEIEVLSSENNEWWYVSHSGQKGYFPASCLKFAPTEKPLPHGWKKHLSPDQRVYYFNESTGISQWTEPVEEQQPRPPPPPPPRAVQKQQSSDNQRTIIMSTSTSPSNVAPPVPVTNEAVLSEPIIRSNDPKLLPPPRVAPPPPPKRTQSNPMPIDYSTPAAAQQAASVMAMNSQRPQSQSIAVSSSHANWPPSPLSGVLETDTSSQRESKSKPTTPSPRSSRSESSEQVARRASNKMALMAKGVDTIVEHHALPHELQEDIMNFSITGYATDHFKKQKKWGLFGRKYIKPSQIVISYTKKYTTSLTILSPANEKRALMIYGHISSYMESEMSISDRKFADLTMEIYRCSEAGMIDEVYCILIKQTTDNPNPQSLERGWELLCAMSMFCLPSDVLMRVVAGHSTNMRFMPNATGALAMAVHSILCDHLKHIQLGTTQPRLLRVDELSFEEHIAPLKNFWLPEKIYGCRIEQVILHEIYHRDPDGVCPLYSELMASRDAVPEILVLLCDYILANGGKSRSGIFREAADVDTVKSIMAQLEVGNYQSILGSASRVEHSRRGSAGSEASVENKRGNGASGRRSSCAAPQSDHRSEYIPINDVLVACDLLKLWFRKMPEPVTGFALYNECVHAGKRDDSRLAEAVLRKMPPLNWSVLKYLSAFLRELSLTSHITNMEITNLSLVFAPNCIKSPSDDPRVFAANADDERRCFRLFVDILCPP